jgi:serine/threonine-protein kinase
VGQSFRNLGVLLRRTGRPRDAEQALRRGLEIARAALPATHPRLADVLVPYGELLLDEGRPQQAETLLREALAIRREHFDEEDKAVTEARQALARALAAQGRDTVAAPLVPEGPFRR